MENEFNICYHLEYKIIPIFRKFHYVIPTVAEESLTSTK